MTVVKFYLCFHEMCYFYASFCVKTFRAADSFASRILEWNRKKKHSLKTFYGISCAFNLKSKLEGKLVICYLFTKTEQIQPNMFCWWTQTIVFVSESCFACCTKLPDVWNLLIFHSCLVWESGLLKSLYKVMIQLSNRKREVCPLHKHLMSSPPYNLLLNQRPSKQCQTLHVVASQTGMYSKSEPPVWLSCISRPKWRNSRCYSEFNPFSRWFTCTVITVGFSGFLFIHGNYEIMICLVGR